jgi:hypothetical protein
MSAALAFHLFFTDPFLTRETLSAIVIISRRRIA